MLEAVLRRDRQIVLVALFVVIALAWGWVLLGSGMGMTAIQMTGMAGMDGWMMTPAVWTYGYAVLLLAMWWVMMLAMMLPGAAPMLLLFARVTRQNEPAGGPLTPTVLFALGYLIVWGGFSLVAVTLQWALEKTRLMSPMLETTNAWLGAAILLAAGLWQLTPIKAMCLRHCRTPLSFLLGHWHAGRWGALRMGLEHGGYCLGCCWFLMALLFFGGIMNLYWIAGLALFVLLEKTLPLGHWLGRIAGIVLLGWGGMLAVRVI